MKKLFSVMAVMLFMSTNVLNAKNAEQELTKCEIRALNVHCALLEEGYSHAEAYLISGIVEKLCEKEGKLETKKDTISDKAN
ncbi:hypothetical protein [Lacinutrix undariae]